MVDVTDRWAGDMRLISIFAISTQMFYIFIIERGKFVFCWRSERKICLCWWSIMQEMKKFGSLLIIDEWVVWSLWLLFVKCFVEFPFVWYLYTNSQSQPWYVFLRSSQGAMNSFLFLFSTDPHIKKNVQATIHAKVKELHQVLSIVYHAHTLWYNG